MKESGLFKKCRILAMDMEDCLFPSDCMDIIISVYGGRWEYIRTDTLYQMVSDLMCVLDADNYGRGTDGYQECIDAVERHMIF